MDFQKYLEIVVPKLGANMAFDLARESKFSAIHKLLIKKGVFSKDELDEEQNLQLNLAAQNAIKIASASGSPFQ